MYGAGTYSHTSFHHCGPKRELAENLGQAGVDKKFDNRKKNKEKKNLGYSDDRFINTRVVFVHELFLIGLAGSR